MLSYGLYSIAIAKMKHSLYICRLNMLLEKWELLLIFPFIWGKKREEFATEKSDSEKTS